MKTVLITGVSGGIGRATAEHLMGAGWRVFGVDIRDCKICEELSGFWKGDVADEKFWQETIIAGLRDAGIYGLVNNAAIQPCKFITDTSLEEWNQTMAVNLGAAFLATKHIVPLMGKKGGSIVNVSSVHAVATSPGMAAYVASKGGLLAFTRVAAIELAERGIRANAVLPGATDTEMLEHGMLRSINGLEKARELLKSRTPLGRLGKPFEISSMIEFLLDGDKAAFVTGQSFVIDGGVLARLSSE